MAKHVVVLLLLLAAVVLSANALVPVGKFRSVCRSERIAPFGSALESATHDDQGASGNDLPRQWHHAILPRATQAALVAALILSAPSVSNAGIDVSGLRQEGGAVSNPDLANQLKAYDGSGAARVREMQQASTSPTLAVRAIAVESVENAPQVTTTATWAYRAAPGMSPSLTKAGLAGIFYRYDDRIVAPPYSKRNSLNVQFEFPSDWLALDRASGGVQYVDQRNGDKLYLLQARLPEGTTLSTVPKSFFGESIFDPNGSLSKAGTVVDEYKVSSSQIISECPDDLCATRRRLKLKYYSVTGNGLRVERRALVDVYDVSDSKSPESSPPVVYMMVASVNANKFEASGSAQRETAERIVNTFRVE